MELPRYDWKQSYDWNYQHAPDPVEIEVPELPGNWSFCGRSVDSPLGIPAGPLLNGKWILYYASLGFDILVYKTVRSRERACYPLPNLQPVQCSQMEGGESDLPAVDQMQGSWAVSFGMPSQHPDVWRKDVQQTRRQLPDGKLLVVSVVGTIQEGWTLEDLADDYALCARWAAESGADVVETNFSCPNVATCDGQLYQQPEAAAVVAERVREAVGETPYLIKIGHVPTGAEASALIDAVAPFADGFAMTNSVAATVTAPTGEQLFDGQKRGICGSAIREASLMQVRIFSELLKHKELEQTLVGVGGAQSAADVRDYLEAGAEAVQLATAAMVDPGVAITIRRDFAAAFAEQVRPDG